MTDYDDLDRELTAAHLEQARRWVEVMGEWTAEAAEAAEQAWEFSQRVGERYLEARYEHEAQAAGFDVTPPVVEDDFDPQANEIENLRSSLAHQEALLRVFEDPHTALDLILAAEDDHAACTALSAHFAIAEEHASTVLLNLGGAGTISSRRSIQEAMEEATGRLRQLGSS
ncbi:hypothetical protein [Nocardioides sp.]|uniref:hypothetical protein n=1 Tax=Nocardioides sp. TaxID=35761 RepID=UPI0027351298|nr:hypothetical protein [Nocardioides sp.]MDP3894299.1 hypothetical protein [Nocardioides sp.]